MSVINDIDINPNSELAKRRWEFQKELTPVSQATVCFGRFNPGVKFEITRVTAWCRNANAAARVNVAISGATCLNPANQAPAIGGGAVPAVLVLAAQAARFGTAADTIDVYLTTDAGQVMDDVLVVIEYRARVYRRSP